MHVSRIAGTEQVLQNINRLSGALEHFLPYSMPALWLCGSLDSDSRLVDKIKLPWNEDSPFYFALLVTPGHTVFD